MSEALPILPTSVVGSHALPGWFYWAQEGIEQGRFGRIDERAHHGYADKAYLFADVAVIGGGASGMQAALDAAGTGAEVILIDDQPRLGGALNYARFDVEGRRGSRLASRLAVLASI